MDVRCACALDGWVVGVGSLLSPIAGVAPRARRWRATVQLWLD